jgi:hypothetical protein
MNYIVVFHLYNNISFIKYSFLYNNFHIKSSLSFIKSFLDNSRVDFY